MAQVINNYIFPGMFGGGGVFGGGGGGGDDSDGDDGDERRRRAGDPNRHGGGHRADNRADPSRLAIEDEEEEDDDRDQPSPSNASGSKSKKRSRTTYLERILGRCTSSRRRKSWGKKKKSSKRPGSGSVTPTYRGEEEEEQEEEEEEQQRPAHRRAALPPAPSPPDHAREIQRLRDDLARVRRQRDDLLRDKGEMDTNLRIAQTAANTLEANVRRAFDRLMDYIEEHLAALDGTVFTPTNPAYGDFDDGRPLWTRRQINPRDPNSAWEPVLARARLLDNTPPAVKGKSSIYTAREANQHFITRMGLDYFDMLYPQNHAARPQQYFTCPFTRKRVPLQTVAPMPIMDQMGFDALGLANQMIQDFPTVLGRADRERLDGFYNERDLVRRTGHLLDTYEDARDAGMPPVDERVFNDWNRSFTELVDFDRLPTDHMTLELAMNPKGVMEFGRVNHRLDTALTRELPQLDRRRMLDNSYEVQGRMSDFANEPPPNGTGVTAANVRTFVQDNTNVHLPPPPPPQPQPQLQNHGPIVLDEDDDNWAQQQQQQQHGPGNPGYDRGA